MHRHRDLIKRRSELKNKITSLKAKLVGAPNTLAREKYQKELNEVKLELQRLN
jgi:hypothetical protein